MHDTSAVFAQAPHKSSEADSAHYRLRSKVGNAYLDIKSIDASRFPIINIIFTALSDNNEFVPTLRKDSLTLLENGIQRPIISLDLMSTQNRVPVDVVFILDVTGSMKDHIDQVKENIRSLATKLRFHGFDFRLGLVQFSDTIPWVSPKLTNDISQFEEWIAPIKAEGGGDIKENALEGLRAAVEQPFRKIAQRIAIIITDAPYHQDGEPGDGTTNLTTETATDMLNKAGVTLYTVTPPDLPEYKYMSEHTHGATFDLGTRFDTVLNGLVRDLSNMYSLKFLSQSTLIPDSVQIDLLRVPDNSVLSHKKMVVLEEGRTFVFEDILFEPSQAKLAEEFIPELEHIVRLMHVRSSLSILIEGNADATGSAETNLKLSQERAESVKRYLVQAGIAPSRIQTVGYGDTHPITTNDTEAGRRINRRIEFVILKK